MRSNLKRLLLLIIIIGNNLLLTAQENSDSRNIRIKLYVNAFHQDIKNHDYHGFLNENETYKFENEKYDIGTISFSVEFGSRKKIKHEVELMPLKFDQNKILTTYTNLEEYGTSTWGYGEFTKSFKSACRYQINYYFVKSKFIMPYFGLSSQFFYELDRYGPMISYYKEKDQFLGLLFAFTPGVIFNINEKISIDLNVLIDLYDIEVNYERKKDEYLRAKTSKIIKEFMPETINVRLGFCYKL
jgi:hypothetical protein